MNASRYLRLSGSLVLVFAVMDCQTDQRNHAVDPVLDCDQRDQSVCAILTTIRSLPPIGTDRGSLPAISDQVELDVGVILSGMRIAKTQH
jgi:hypothetical protein